MESFLGKALQIRGTITGPKILDAGNQLFDDNNEWGTWGFSDQGVVDFITHGPHKYNFAENHDSFFNDKAIFVLAHGALLYFSTFLEHSRAIHAELKTHTVIADYLTKRFCTLTKNRRHAERNRGPLIDPMDVDQQNEKLRKEEQKRVEARRRSRQRTVRHP